VSHARDEAESGGVPSVELPTGAGPGSSPRGDTPHPLANGEVGGVATPAGVWLAGGRIDTLAACAGEIVTTCPRAVAHVLVEYGVAQVRRRVATRTLALLHVVFAPSRPRPLLLGIARLRNLTREPLLVNYSELWAVEAAPARGAEGACVATVIDGECALADASAVIRARPPEPLPESGLALDVRIVLPPGAVRQLTFAYVAAEIGTAPAALVRAWRGDVLGELARTVAAWEKAAPDDPIATYRARYAASG
jgi:hypothetical protein